MWKSLKRMFWIALLILIGIQLGLYQAAKSQATATGTHTGTGPQNAGGTRTGSTASAGEGWGQGLVRQVKGLAQINLPHGEAAPSPEPADGGVNGSGYSTADNAAGSVAARIDGSERPESFLNRLGNKLGEALRMLVSAVIGWVAGFFSSLLN